jgi:hypothetical protein
VGYLEFMDGVGALHSRERSKLVSELAVGTTDFLVVTDELLGEFEELNVSFNRKKVSLPLRRPCTAQPPVLTSRFAKRGCI